jgi:porin
MKAKLLGCLALAAGIGMSLPAAADEVGGDDTGAPGSRRTTPTDTSTPPARRAPEPGSSQPDRQTQGEVRQRDRNLPAGRHAGSVHDGSHSGLFEKIWHRDTLTGNWGGLRTDLHDRGVDIQVRLSQYGQWVTSGGVDTNGEYGGRADYRLNVNLTKLVGAWEGLSVNLHAMSRFGNDISADAGAFALPNAGLIMPLPGDYEGTQVTGLTVTQSLFDGRADLFFGKLDVIDLVTGFFPWIGFGQEGFWNVNALVSALPWFGAVRGLSLWGGGAWTVKNEMVQGGFIFAGTENVTTSWEFSDSFDEGVFLAGFYRFFWELGDRPGNFLVFAGGSTRDQASNDPHDIIAIPGQGIVSTDQKNPWDIAVYVQQEFWQAENDPSRKAQFVIGGTGGPDNPQFAQWHLFGMVEAYGPMASRPRDRMGISGWVSGLSDNFRKDVSPVVDVRDYTWGIELYYNIEINKWLHLTPDFQFVQNQNESDDIAIIPGVRLVMDF